MSRDEGCFEDYMGVQYRQGQQARRDGLKLSDNPYDPDGLSGQMAEAWIAGWNDPE